MCVCVISVGSGSVRRSEREREREGGREIAADEEREGRESKDHCPCHSLAPCFPLQPTFCASARDCCRLGLFPPLALETALAALRLYGAPWSFSLSPTPRPVLDRRQH